MGLMDKNPETSDSQGDTAVCFCMAAALAGLILDEEAMEVVVQRQEAAPLFENCLSLLARTLHSLEPSAEVGHSHPHVVVIACLIESLNPKPYSFCCLQQKVSPVALTCLVIACLLACLFD